MDRDPFIYAGALQELTQAMQYLLQAQQWKEGVGEAATEDEDARNRRERGNLLASLAHAGNAMRVISDRVSAVEVKVRRQEAVAMAETLPAIQRLVAQPDAVPSPGAEP